MTGVSLDTSGSVAVYPWEGGEIAPQVRWGQLSPFEQGYVEALFASIALAGWMGDLFNASFTDLAHETLAAIRKDCAAYLGKTWSGNARIGTLFWKNRQGGHCDEMGFPPLTPTLSEDGKVRFQ